MLSIKDFNCGYKYNKDYVKIINNLNLDIFSGEFVCVCGSNGVGKSTFINCLANLEFDNLIIEKKSKVFFCDIDLFKLKKSDFAKQVSCLIQNEYPIWNYKVFDFVLNGRYPFTKRFVNYSKEDVQLVEDIFNILNIQDLKNKDVLNLSGGEFQKIRIARTLVQNTPIILLDEPINSLDYCFRQDLLQLLKIYAQQKNKIIICSIHELNLATIYADKILLLGKDNFFYGTPEQVITVENLSKIYKKDFGLFIHPKYNCLQTYIKK